MPAGRMRPELNDLRPEQIAPLEARMPGAFPDTWRDFARSHYLTLLARYPGRALDELAEEAVDLACGIGQDLGGTQP